MLFIEYPPCTTCKKAKAWLEEHGIEFTARHIKEEKPSYDELKTNKRRYADTGIMELIQDMNLQGASTSRLVAKIAENIKNNS